VITDSADVWALLDPVGLREVNALFLQLNRSQTNVLDFLTRRGAGKYYAFSGLSTFLGLHAIAALDGASYTSSMVANRTVAAWMDDISTSWTELARSAPVPGFPGMADYGGSPNNFLECVPTYVHAVAALQAGNTWSKYTSSPPLRVIYGYTFDRLLVTACSDARDCGGPSWRWQCVPFRCTAPHGESDARRSPGALRERHSRKTRRLF
jgi:hypothetical protein